MADDYKMSYKQRQRLRHASISQHEQIFYGVQGEATRRMQDHIATRGRVWVPAHRWVRAGFTPPQWMSVDVELSGDRVCLACNQPFKGESAEWDGDVLVFRHADGDCRIGESDENE